MGEARAGRNPSSVLGGIRLCGLPPSRATAHRRCLPLHPTDWPFHPSPPHLNFRIIVRGGGFRFCSRSGPPGPALAGSWCCQVDGVSSGFCPTAAHRLAPPEISRNLRGKIFPVFKLSPVITPYPTSQKKGEAGGFPQSTEKSV